MVHFCMLGFVLQCLAKKGEFGFVQKVSEGF